MADAFAFSPRRLPSAQCRTPRSPLPPAATCLDVQWTFLSPQPLPKYSPHHNREILSSPNASTRLADKFDNASARDELLREQARLRTAKEAHDAHEQRVLYDLMGETQRQAMLDKVMAEMEAMALMPVRRLASPRRGRQDKQADESTVTPAARRSSVLPTHGSQRDVELLPQRRLTALSVVDVSALEVNSPAASDDSDRDSDDSSSDDEEDDGSDNHGRRGSGGGDRRDSGDAHTADIPELRAIRDRQRRRTERKSIDMPGKPRETHIRWQKTAHACVAMDLPPALLDEEEDDEDEGAGENENEERLREEDPLADLFPLSEEAVRDTQRRRSTQPAKKLRKNKTNTRSPARSPSHQEEQQHPPDPLDSTRSPHAKRAAYGSWYVPRDEWWLLHQTQQEALAERFPLDVPPPVERHRCERPSPDQRPKGSLAALQNQPTQPHAWPSLLRSPVASPRVMPLMRAARTVATAAHSAAPPATSHAARSPRTSTVSHPMTPPATSGEPSRAGTAHTTGQQDRNAATAGGSIVSPRSASIAPVAPTNALPDAIAQRAAKLQREIPQAYIAREYRNYLAAKGARVPSYLNY